MSLSKSSFFGEYRKWVIHHSDILGQIETIGRMTSYLIAGRAKRSPAFSEFLYSATNIIVFINDQILLHAFHSGPDDGVPSSMVEKTHLYVTMLEYLEVFLEISATKLWGQQGKWIIITIIQSIKFLWRLLVLIKKRSGFGALRPIPPLNRKKLMKPQSQPQNRNFVVDSEVTGVTSAPVFSLPKSGRVIRTVNGAPQMRNRNWKVPANTIQANEVRKTSLEGYPLIGEVFYAAKPIVHLAAMRRFGTSSWLPWLLALGMDITSIKLSQYGSLSKEEQKEIKRRQLTLLMYLLRSPFYDRFSRQVLYVMLTKLGRLPLIGVLPKHILQYLPYWQQIYSYTWD